MVNKNTDLFLTAKGLSADTSMLRSLSRRLYSLQLLAILYPLIFFVLLVVLSYRLGLEPLKTLALAIYNTTFIFFLYYGMRRYYHLKWYYHRVMEECSSLVDDIDWNVLRKKQVHGELDDRIQFAIDDFYEYNSSALCPFEGGRARFSRKTMFLFTVFICVTTVSVFYAFGLLHPFLFY